MDKIICVGKNYREHAKELGDAIPEKPVLFLKPPSVLLQILRADTPVQVHLPRGRGDVHHECEIVVRLNKGGANWTSSEAAMAFDAVTLGLDMTLREEQSRLKKNGHPWEISKVFAGSAIVGPWLPGNEAGAFLDSEFHFALNGNIRQRGRLRDMSFTIAECLAHASQYFPLCAGDVIFTGTPAGVGPVQAGQRGTMKWGGKLLAEVDWL